MAGIGTWRNPYGPLAVNVPLFFEVPESAIFSCETAGHRCSFDRNHYADPPDVDPDTGSSGVAALLDGDVWTVSNPASDRLTLRNCKLTNGCMAVCFQQCECKYLDGTSCSQTTPFPTASPNTAPPTPEPAPKVCAMKKNVERCAEVAREENTGPGQECDYCWNFCNGKFLSCCGEDQNCGSATCVPESDDAEVFGCESIQLTSDENTGGGLPSKDDNSQQNGSAALTLQYSQSPIFAAVATLLMLARW